MLTLPLLTTDHAELPFPDDPGVLFAYRDDSVRKFTSFQRQNISNFYLRFLARLHFRSIHPARMELWDANRLIKFSSITNFTKSPHPSPTYSALVRSPYDTSALPSFIINLHLTNYITPQPTSPARAYTEYFKALKRSRKYNQTTDTRNIVG